MRHSAMYSTISVTFTLILVLQTIGINGKKHASKQKRITTPSAIRRINNVVEVTTRISSEIDRIADIKLINEPKPVKSPYFFIGEDDKNHRHAGHWITSYAGFQFSFEIMLIVSIPILYGQLMRRVLRRYIYPRLNFPEESIEEHPLIPLTYLQQTRDELRVTREKRNGLDWLGTKFLIRASDSFVDLKELMNTQASSDTPKSPWQLLRVLAAFNGIYTRNRLGRDREDIVHMMPSTTSRIAARLEPTDSILETLNEEQLEIAFQQGLLRKLPATDALAKTTVPRSVVPRRSVAVGTSSFFVPEAGLKGSPSGDHNQGTGKAKAGMGKTKAGAGKAKAIAAQKKAELEVSVSKSEELQEASIPSLVKQPSEPKVEETKFIPFTLNGKTYLYKRHQKTPPQTPKLEPEVGLYPDEFGPSKSMSSMNLLQPQEKINEPIKNERTKMKERTLAKRANRVEAQKAKIMGEARVKERLTIVDVERLELEQLRLKEEERQRNEAILQKLQKDAEAYKAKIAKEKREAAHIRNLQAVKPGPTKRGAYWNRLQMARNAANRAQQRDRPTDNPTDVSNQEDRHAHRRAPPPPQFQLQRPRRKVIAQISDKHYMKQPRRVVEALQQLKRNEPEPERVKPQPKPKPKVLGRRSYMDLNAGKGLARDPAARRAEPKKAAPAADLHQAESLPGITGMGAGFNEKKYRKLRQVWHE